MEKEKKKYKMRIKTKEEIMREFIRAGIIADKSYLRGLLFCLGRNDLRVMTDAHVREIVMYFKEELKN